MAKEQRLDCGPDGGCEECKVCEYLNWLDWVHSVAGPTDTIQRNKELDDYLKATYPDSF